MLGPWSVVAAGKTTGDLRELRGVYGEHVQVSRVGAFNLVHLDSPDAEEIRRRVEAFDPDDLLDENCPLCRALKLRGADVIFIGKRQIE